MNFINIYFSPYHYYKFILIHVLIENSLSESVSLTKILISGEKYFIYEEQRFFLKSDSEIRIIAQMEDLYPKLTNKNMIEFESNGKIAALQDRFGKNIIDIEVPSILKIFYYDVFRTG